MNYEPSTMNPQQSTSHILMIRPVNFGFNQETAASNSFQKDDADIKNVQQKALNEFDAMVNTLRDNGVDVTVIDDTLMPYTPDSIFPNNWISFHQDGGVFLYPMQAENRRLERREDIIMQLEDCFAVKHVIDLSHFEHEHQFLEGTGSMVLDREHKIVYACVSPRTDQVVLDVFCEQNNFTATCFDAVDEHSKPIYHTNVLMCVGAKFAVICMDSIPNPHERVMLTDSFKSTHKEIIEISFEQMNQFAGNMLEVKNKSRESLIIMSKSAFNSLYEEQKSALKQYGRLVYADINTIETNGGGSVRCMMAEVFLPLVDGQ